MRGELKALALLLALGVGTDAGAEDLLAVYQLAKSADPQYQTAISDNKAAQELLVQARGSYLPSVDLGYDASRLRQHIRDSDNELYETGSEVYPTSVIALSLSQPIFRRANYVRIKQASVEVRQANALLANAEQELLLRVAERYINALAASDNLEYVSAEEAALRRQLEFARARQHAELGRTSDVLEAEARLASVEADYSDALVNLEDTYQALAETTGMLLDDLNRLKDEFPMALPAPNDPEQWVVAAEQQNWELEAQRQALEVSRKEIELQKSGHYPTVDLSLQKVLDDTGGSVFGGGSEVETDQVMVSFKLPIYQGGITSSSVREAIHKHESNRSELARIKLKVAREVRRSFSTILSAEKRVRALQKEVLSQQEVLKFKGAGYKSGIETNLSVLDAERDLYSAKRDYSKSRYDYILSSIRLKALAGTLSEQDLQSVNEWLTSQ